MWQEVFLTDNAIQEKARQIHLMINGKSPPPEHYGTKFSYEWLAKFKKHHYLKCYESHEKEGALTFQRLEMRYPYCET